MKAPKLDLGMSPTAFLTHHWQKRPCLIRGALTGFIDPLSPEELAGLACEPEVESRLVLGSADGGWELRHGPFGESTFTDLPAVDWTLLVQDVEKHLPALVALLEPFRFIPDWRMDDLMVSYAARGGSVGPHVDSYDVFLIQGLGRRRWEIAEPQNDPPLVAGLELRVMADFQASESWELEPGDMLYLPPGVPHHGVALEPCLTYSVGFRSPSVGELLVDLAHSLAGELDPDWRYGDLDLQPVDNPGQLDAAVVDRVRALLDRALALDDSTLGNWFARVVTSPKVEFAAQALDHPFTAQTLGAELSAGEPLERNPGSRLAYRAEETGLQLYVDGQGHGLDPGLDGLVRLLCARHSLDRATLEPWLDDPRGMELLLLLVNGGHLLIYDHDEEPRP